MLTQAVVQIERKIAPFWRGLDDFNESWAEHQIVAAARGLDIPPADEVPEDLTVQPASSTSPDTSLQNINSLTVPMGPRTLSASSDKTGSNPGSALPSPTSPSASRLTSPLRPRKAIAAALSISSRNGSQQEIAPREISLPHDPLVNGQQIEVFLYKDGTECPICCMYYPRYLNKTRCCDQLICSECFVQIRRPDPHLPEHHGDQREDGEAAGQQQQEEATGELVMEAACCPYCTQADFGVTYEPPPFRRGLSYAFSATGLGTMGTAMSSTSSLGSSLSPTSATTPAAGGGRRRAHSLSAGDPSVISTDRIRPDWVTKLNAARAQQRRRAAAADALHHAAFVMGQNESSRSLFGRSGRFSRRHTGGNGGSESPGSGSNQAAGNQGSDSPPEPGARGSSARTGPSRERIDAAHLESMMMAEAIRLSLADEEERRKKAEKEAKKEAKKKEKEERKANKRKSSIYGHSEGGSSASASSLSLGLGRRRNNSAGGGQSLRVEASVAAANATASQAGDTPTAPAASATAAPQPLSSAQDAQDKGKSVDRGDGGSSSLPIPISQPSRGSSHLRQMSNASSLSTSELESLPASLTNGTGADGEDPRASELSLGGGRSDDDGAGTEPMFNFNSLAQMVGVPLDGSELSPGGETPRDGDSDKASQEHHEHVEHAEPDSPAAPSPGSALTLDIDAATSPAGKTQGPAAGGGAQAQPPSLMITPETPAPLPDEEEDAKRLGHATMVERPNEVTQ